MLFKRQKKQKRKTQRSLRLEKYGRYQAYDRDVRFKRKRTKKEKKTFRTKSNKFHTVVFLGFTKDKKAKIKTITSLEKGFTDRRIRHWRTRALIEASEGKIDPIPRSAIGSHHWSGVHSGMRYIDPKKLRQSSLFAKKKIPKKYQRRIS